MYVQGIVNDFVNDCRMVANTLQLLAQEDGQVGKREGVLIIGRDGNVTPTVSEERLYII
jgi:hypothetical protein